MPLTVIAFGKMKEPFFYAAAREYLKRLNRFVKADVIELPDLARPERLSPEEGRRLLEKEGESLLKRLAPGDYLIALAIDGERLSSEALSARLQARLASGRRAVFAIGSSDGLGDNVLARADARLSFSPMTFPHQLARVMLLEQLYRACTINAHTRYHK